ncbi:hypothetical protein G9A89_016440 [Geosiphon pyriformis]|nr:hypothetical protein G9A89_016440 [Geosiphon pyriformis]
MARQVGQQIMSYLWRTATQQRNTIGILFAPTKTIGTNELEKLRPTTTDAIQAVT